MKNILYCILGIQLLVIMAGLFCEYVYHEERTAYRICAMLPIAEIDELPSGVVSNGENVIHSTDLNSRYMAKLVANYIFLVIPINVGISLVLVFSFSRINGNQVFALMTAMLSAAYVAYRCSYYA
jgi:hypothetical protein